MTEKTEQVNRQERGGADRWSRTKIVRQAFTADEAAPANTAAGIKAGSRVVEFKSAQWVVLMPSWCTGFDVAIYRLIEVFNRTGAPLVQQWVHEDDVAGQTESLLYYQPSDGQDLLIRVHNILGVADPASGFKVLLTGVNR